MKPMFLQSRFIDLRHTNYSLPELGIYKCVSFSFYSGMHPDYLLQRKHEHRVVIGVVHVVHKHVAILSIAAGNMREDRFTKVWPGSIGCIFDKICSATVLSIAPNVAQVKKMSNLVGC